MSQVYKLSAKQFLLLAIFSVVNCFCSAQVPFSGDKTPDAKTSKGVASSRSRSKPPPQFAIKFQGNHDFYLTVDGKKNERTPKDKSKVIGLDLGVHSIVFEEADSTGETIEHYIRVTKEMIKQSNDSLHTVIFKNDFIDIIQPNAALQPNQIKPKQR